MNFGLDIGSAIGGLAGALGNIGQVKRQKKLMKYQSKLQEEQAQRDFDRNKQMNEITNTQNRQNVRDTATLNVEGAKQAGVSVAGIMGNGGSQVAAASGQGSSTPGSSIPPEGSNPVEMFMRMLDMKADLDLKKSEKNAQDAVTEHTREQTKGERIRNDNMQTDYDTTFDLRRSSVAQIEKNMSYTDQLILKERASTENIELQNQLQKRIQDFEVSRAEGEAKKVWEEAARITQEREQSKESFDAVLKNLYADLDVKANQAAMLNNLASVYEADATLKSYDIEAMQQEVVVDGKKMKVGQIAALAQATDDMLRIMLRDVHERLERGELSRIEADVEGRKIENQIRKNQARISSAEAAVKGTKAYQLIHVANQEINTATQSFSNVASPWASIKNAGNYGQAVQNSRDMLDETIRNNKSGKMQTEYAPNGKKIKETYTRPVSRTPPGKKK